MRVEVILGTEKSSNIIQVSSAFTLQSQDFQGFFLASGDSQHQAGGRPEQRDWWRDQKLPAGFKNIRGTEILCGKVSRVHRSISSEIKDQAESLPCSILHQLSSHQTMS